MMCEKASNSSSGMTNRLLAFLFLGMTLFFIGVAVLVIAVVVLGGSGSVGGVIFIGPIPIVFGGGPNSAWLILVSLIVATLSIVLFVLSSGRRKS